MKENENDIMDEFEENNSKKKKFSIRMDITMDKEMSYEAALLIRFSFTVSGLSSALS